MSLTISGYITDDAGNGINGATVELYADGSGSVTSSTTTAADSNSQNGYWTFAGAANGLYKVKISYASKVRWLYGASIPQFNGIIVGANKFSVDSSGNTVIAGTLNVTGTITGTLSGSSSSTTGNAATATALQNARTINGTSFDGTANITVTAAAGTLTGATLAAGVTASSLTSFGASPTLSSPTLSGTVSGTPSWASSQALNITGSALALRDAVGCTAAAASYSGSTATAVSFTSEDFNTVGSGMHSTSVNPSRFIANNTGRYLFTYYCGFAVNGGGNVSARVLIRKNGTTTVSDNTQPTISSGQTLMSGTIPLVLNANDYIEFMLDNESGGSMASTSTGIIVSFSRFL